MISERNEAAQHREQSRGSDFFPQFFSPPSRSGIQSFATHRQTAGLQCSTLGIVAPGKATTDLKSKIDRLLSEQGIDQAPVWLSRGRRSPGLRLNSQTKPSFKTTELIIYVPSVLGVVISSKVVDRS